MRCPGVAEKNRRIKREVVPCRRSGDSRKKRREATLLPEISEILAAFRPRLSARCLAIRDARCVRVLTGNHRHDPPSRCHLENSEIPTGFAVKTFARPCCAGNGSLARSSRIGDVYTRRFLFSETAQRAQRRRSSLGVGLFLRFPFSRDT